VGAVRAAGHHGPHRADDRRAAGGLSQLDLPLILGTVVTPDPDRARAAGAAGAIIHLLVGRAFAFGYAAVFALLGHATWWLGALLGTLHAAVHGAVHGAVALTVLVRMLVGVHPHMASERAGPASTAVLEPPGLLALNYGTQTPLVTFAAHLAYGTALGRLLGGRWGRHCDGGPDRGL
jgi:hypothetical protein